MELKLALEASAGSGKTFSLSLRYIALLFRGATPSSIVALTFTKKSANEMKERIFETLAHLESKSAELNELSNILECSHVEILQKKDAILESFNNSSIYIETIDAFVGRILRKFSLYCSLMPDFEVTSSLEKIKIEFLKSLIANNELGQFVDFCVEIDKKDDDIVQFLAYLWEKKSEFDTLSFEEVELYDEDEIFEVLNRLKNYAILNKGSQTAINSFNVSSYGELLSKGFLERESLDYRTYSKIFTAELDEIFFELKAKLAHKMQNYERRVLLHLKKYFDYYCEVRQKTISKDSKLEFIDISNLTHELLKHSVDKEFLYFRLDGAISHLLIDEFQDTSISQFEILSPIIEEIASGVGVKEDRSIFYVGDVKQSIYRFRGGEQSLFYDVASRYEISVGALDTNYRSQNNLVEFVNATFEGILPHYKHQKPSKNSGGYVEVCEGEELKELVCQKVEWLLENGVKSDDIALLCRSNSDANEFKDALLERFESLHVSTQANLFLRDDESVALLIEFAKFCYFKDEFYWENVTSCVDVEKRIFEFNEPLNEVFFEMAGYLGLSGQNLIYFFEELKKFSDIEEFLFSLDRFDTLSLSKEDMGIKVLTIHKSKGLEFEYVIVCDKIGAKPQNRDKFIYDYDGLNLTQIVVKQKKREFFDDNYALTLAKEEQKAQTDQLNLLYVALTRAKTGLIVAKKSEKSEFEILGLSECKIGEILLSQKSQKSDKKLLNYFEPSSIGLQNYKTEKEFGSYEAKLFGNAVHEIFEFAHAFDEQSFTKAWQRIKSRYFFEDEPLHRAMRLLENETFKDLLVGAKVSKEQPIVFRGLQKQVDLLLEFEDKMVVIDYKTSQNVSAKERAQVEFYKEAIENITKKRTIAYLFYLHVDDIEIIKLT